jgi:hypothetical protein
MSLEVGQPIAAAAMTQVKLCPYDEEEPAIWFCLIKAQFAIAGIKTQKPICQYFGQPAEASPSGHFGHSECL